MKRKQQLSRRKRALSHARSSDETCYASTSGSDSASASVLNRGSANRTTLAKKAAVNKRKMYEPEHARAALAEMANGMTVRQASLKFNVPIGQLCRT